jgi:hypothetical protein
MASVRSRLERLEARRPIGLSLELRAWLGHRLTDEERAELEAMPVELYLAPTEKDMADWSPEMREWWSGRGYSCIQPG